jgi:hypothetical protein
MMRLKVMKIDDQVEMIEQTAQESLKVREVNKEVEATEAHRRGMLLLEEDQRVIQILENDHQLNPLIEPLRIILVNTINLGEELNSSEKTPLEETDYPENPSIMSQWERSSVASKVQIGGTRTLSGTYVPNVFIDLITIYGDEKSSGVSLITPVPITDEGEPGETSSITLEALNSIPQEGDNKYGSILDIEFLDQSGIHPKKDSSKDKLGSSEQEEEMQRSKIDISLAIPQVNDDPFPLSPYKV